MSGTTILPLVAVIQDGQTVGALMDEKSFSKSRENGILWICHPGTGRILPWKGDTGFLTLEQKGTYYFAELPSSAAAEPYDIKLNEVDIEEHHGIGTAEEGDEHSDILGSLTDTIRKRHQTMPEGSYTTHLFEKGPDKIRKKTGEEAVELLLARSKEDLIYESADLIYHLMVLLEAENLSIQDVLKELKRRDS